MDEVLNAAIELHDSVVSGFERTADALVIKCRPAYIHKSKGRPGIDAGVGVVQDLAIRIEGASVAGNFGDLPADVFDGELKVGAETSPNMIALPCSIVDSVRLSLHLSPDYRQVSVSGRRMDVTLEGEAEYVEEFRP
jgi:hypothetical protein